MFGDRMMIANATGCSSIWGASAPATPYCTDKRGHGPAWANSLFEDNAEFGLGMYLECEASVRDRMASYVSDTLTTVTGDVKVVMQDWLDKNICNW